MTPLSPPELLLHRQGRCSGFILVDTLVALTILAFGFTSLIHLHTQILDLGGRTKTRAEALRLAEGRLEQLRYTALQTHTDDWTAAGEESLAGATTQFQLHWFTSKTVDSNVRLITVTAAWETAKGAQNFTITSRVAGVEPLATNLLSTSEI